MIAATLVAAISCWSLFAAGAKHGPNGRAAYFDGDVVRRYRTTASTASTAGAEHCCAGQSLSTAPAIDGRTVDSNEIPLDVIVELNQVINVSELFTKFMPDTNMDEAQRLFVTTGFQSRTALKVERKGALMPKPASCSIESQTVSLKDTDDRSLYYFPSCTRVDRCGGCCSHDLLACQPTKTETLHVEVLVSKYNGGVGKLEFLGRKTVSIDRHLKCKCECVVKEENCSPLQVYNQKDCRCTCSNEDDEAKCNVEHVLKHWNSTTCKCECREIKECTSGFGFDNYTCGCEPLRIRTKNTGTHLNRNKYSLVIS